MVNLVANGGDLGQFFFWTRKEAVRCVHPVIINTQMFVQINDLVISCVSTFAVLHLLFREGGGGGGGEEVDGLHSLQYIQ